MVAEASEESVTSAVKSKVAGAVGVPEITPLLARFSPSGSAPADTDHVYPDPLPPVAAKVAE